MTLATRCFAALLLLCAGILRAQQGRTVAIPEGTSVTVHVLGATMTGCRYLPNGPETQNEIVVQVDREVVVEGAVVIPRGSLGMAHIDSSTYASRKPAPHQEPIVTSCTIHLVSVFSIDSRPLALDPAPIQIVEKRHSRVLSLCFSDDAQFTGKLHSATVQVAR